MTRESLGWLLGTWAAKLPLVLLMVGFGHSVLAMSGEESLAQVNREIEHPKLKNLEKTGLVIFIYSLLFTSLVSFFAVMIIPDNVRPDYFANLISGLAMNMVGPYTLRLYFPGLRGGRRRADTFGCGEHGHRGRQRRAQSAGGRRRPHLLVQEAAQQTYGTSYRVLNLIAGLQLLTIVASRGDVYLLASLYAFGVIWSFSFMSLAVLVLRYKLPQKREWKVPGNFKIARSGNPGRGRADLGRTRSQPRWSTCSPNNWRPSPASASARCSSWSLPSPNAPTPKQHAKGESELEQFRVAAQEELTADAMDVRPGSILVAVRDPKNLAYLQTGAL